jgi:riboflavin synthase
MFTGLIEDVGELLALRTRGGVRELTIRSQLPGGELRSGESIAVHGVCLTLTEDGKPDGTFRVEAVPETLRRSCLKSFRVGDRVHLERALRAGDRLGGHLVQGHVDEVGRIRRTNRSAGEHLIEVSVRRSSMRYVVEKGSIAIDGISLTVATRGTDWFRVAFIPKTEEGTLVAGYRVGREVNLEFDLIAKYVESLLGGFRSTTPEG